MNTADLAIIAVAAVSGAHGYWHHRFRMAMAPRVRVVNPVKQPETPKPAAETAAVPAAGDDERHSILELGRTA